MKAILHTLEMPLQKWRNYKITEVSQVHMIAFWITLVPSVVLTVVYLVANS
ncbi:MAG: hypothetical protein JWP12_2222 [Bacteroidetes bacterium]|nr:hypothetical protein [Bacteroidota bacterium]